MNIEILTLPEIRDVYHHRLIHDFPPDERKPLSMIEASLKNRQYVCYGMKDPSGILAYAFFVVIHHQYLLDYFAVRTDSRGTGIGGRFLQELCGNCLKDASCILAEVVDPCSQSNPEEKITCERRIRFYLNSGLQNTGVRVNTFGVSYLLLEAPNASRHSIEDVRQIYAMIYRSILPDDVFPLKVHI